MTTSSSIKVNPLNGSEDVVSVDFIVIRNLFSKYQSPATPDRHFPFLPDISTGRSNQKSPPALRDNQPPHVPA